jgi:hypothetical protein
LIDQVEKLKASVRAKVEHPFRVIKRQFDHVKVGYRGLKKNTAQLITLFALSNLWMARGRLLAAQAWVHQMRGPMACRGAKPAEMHSQTCLLLTKWRLAHMTRASCLQWHSLLCIVQTFPRIPVTHDGQFDFEHFCLHPLN